MAELLNQDGLFSTRGYTQNELIDMLQDSVRGTPVYTPGGREHEAKMVHLVERDSRLQMEEETINETLETLTGDEIMFHAELFSAARKGATLEDIRAVMDSIDHSDNSASAFFETVGLIETLKNGQTTEQDIAGWRNTDESDGGKQYAAQSNTDTQTDQEGGRDTTGVLADTERPVADNVRQDTERAEYARPELPERPGETETKVAPQAASDEAVVTSGVPQDQTPDSVGDSSGDIDRKANQAATSPQNSLREPSEAQKQSGRYKKGHINVNGFDIAIENPKGSVRSGTDPNGKAWENKIHHHYGELKKTEGADGDAVDVFVGEDTESQKVFVIDQVNPDGGFDEHKVMMGFGDKLKARAGYQKNYDKGWKVGPVTEMSIDEFRGWLSHADTTQPVDKGLRDAANKTVQKARPVPGSTSLEASSEGNPLTSETFRARPSAHSDTIDPSLKKANQDAETVNSSTKKDALPPKAQALKDKAMVANIQKVINTAVTNTEGNQGYVVYREVDAAEAKAIKAATGLDVRNYTHGIDESAVRHIFKEHGDVEEELRRNQIAVTQADIAAVPSLTVPDNLDMDSVRNTTPKGLQVVKYKKRINGHFIVIEEVRDRRGRLALKTMWKTRAPNKTVQKVRPAPGSTSLEASSEGNPLTSETFRARPSTHSDTIDPSLKKANQEVKTVDSSIKKKKDGGTIDPDKMLFSKGSILPEGATPKGVGVKHVELVAKAFLEKYRGANDGLQVRVYLNQKDAFGRDAPPGNVRVKGGFNPKTNTVDIIADNHESTSDVLHTLQHEIIVHKGLGLFDAQTEQAIIDAILVNAPKSRLLKPLWDKVQTDYADDSPRIQAEELLARVAQTDLSIADKFWHKIVSVLRRALVKMGWIKKEMSQHDLMGVIYTMADAFKEGKRARPRGVMPAAQLAEDVLAAAWTGDEGDASNVRYSKADDDALLSKWHRKLSLARKSEDPWFTINLEAPQILKTLKVLSSIKLTKNRIVKIETKHPEVPVDVLNDLPNYLADPLVIYLRPGGNETNLVIEAMTKAGEPILIGLREGTIRTITPKNNAQDKSGAQRLAEEINRSQVIYARDKKALDNARAYLEN